jgi:urease accessory protein
MTAEPLGRPGLYRLLAWLSPSFPTGAFSYSHGLEATLAGGAVRDRPSLEAWIASVVTQGSGRIDADIVCEAYRAAQAGDFAALDAANRRGLAFRATAELALEAAQQGAAFLNTCRAAWPEAFLEGWAGSRNRSSPPSDPPPQAGEGRVGAGAGAAGRASADEGVCHAAIFGAAAARAGITLADALVGYLEAFAANLVSAGLRLGIIGQTDGQRILAALEPVVAHAATAAMTRDMADFGAATFAVDLASMAHETQYTRLFRS